MADLRKRLLNKMEICVSRSRCKLQDVDEIQILHSHCAQTFPDSSNDLFKEYQNSSTESARVNWLSRLLNILSIENSIPDEVKSISKHDATNNLDLVPMFEISEKDKLRIFDLCDKMRKIVLATVEFDQPHKIRLLNRIAAIEAETQKPRGMFDVVLGGVSDVGETLGKFGKDIKPLTDRMKEVAGITRKGTKEYDQIPAPDEIKQLPKPDGPEDE